MLTWSNTKADGTTQTIGQRPVYMNAITGGTFVFSPTCMNLDSVSLLRNPATRTASTCYAKGLSEHLRIQTSSGVPWFHRRICITLRGDNAFAFDRGGSLQTYAPYVDTSNGIERLFLNAAVNNQVPTTAAQFDLLFKGTENQDWNDPIIAPVDTARVDLKFDKTWTLQSGNNNGIVRERKLWHPMNKNIVYNEDEIGETEGTSYYSTSSKRGMGDYYVIDIIRAGEGGGATDLLRLDANSTYYWHEK